MANNTSFRKNLLYNDYVRIQTEKSRVKNDVQKIWNHSPEDTEPFQSLFFQLHDCNKNLTDTWKAYTAKRNAFSKIGSDTDKHFKQIFDVYKEEDKKHSAIFDTDAEKSKYGDNVVYKMNVNMLTSMENKYQKWNNLSYAFPACQDLENVFSGSQKDFKEGSLFAKHAALFAGKEQHEHMLLRMQARLLLQDLLQAAISRHLWGSMQFQATKKHQLVDRYEMHAQERRIREALYYALMAVCETSQAAVTPDGCKFHIGGDLGGYVHVSKQLIMKAYPPRVTQEDYSVGELMQTVCDLDKETIFSVQVVFADVFIYVTKECSNGMNTPYCTEMSKTVICPLADHLTSGALDLENDKANTRTNTVCVDLKKGLTPHRLDMKSVYVLTRLKSIQTDAKGMKNMVNPVLHRFQKESVGSGSVTRNWAFLTCKWKDVEKKEFMVTTKYSLKMCSVDKRFRLKRSQVPKWFTDCKRADWDMERVKKVCAREFAMMEAYRDMRGKYTEETVDDFLEQAENNHEMHEDPVDPPEVEEDEDAVHGGSRTTGKRKNHEKPFVNPLRNPQENSNKTKMMRQQSKIRDTLQLLRRKFAEASSVQVIRSSLAPTEEKPMERVHALEKKAAQAAIAKKMATPTLSIKESQMVAAATAQKLDLGQAMHAARRMFA